MQDRESIVAEFWKRMSQVSGVTYTARNPKAEPAVSDLPAILFFELDDMVEGFSSRGGSQYPQLTRKLNFVVETYIKGTTEGAATKELLVFVNEVKKKVYEAGITLGARCVVTEKSSSRIYRPPAGDHVIGIGITFDLRYTEDVGKLF